MPLFTKKELNPKLLNDRLAKIKGYKARMDLQRTLSDRMADSLTDIFGTTWFFAINAIWFFSWIILNLPLLPGVKPFDPYPFGFLTMVVSLEAIFLSIIVLISQKRAADIEDLREEIDLQLNVKAEQEITKILNILDEIHDHMGLPSEDDEELARMKKPTDLGEIEAQLRNERH